MANIGERVGTDANGVAKGMRRDQRMSSKFLHPGPGFGAPLFPKIRQPFKKSFKDPGFIDLRNVDEPAKMKKLAFQYFAVGR
jgi:UDP-glucose 6-dehydrogenase